MKKKVLIFYISKHSGHFHAAKALKKGFLEIDADIEVRIVNALEYAKPILSKIINKAYIQVIKKKPEIWGSIYDDPDVLKKTAKARRTLNRISLPKIKELLDEFSPDIIFCTQAFPCGLVVDYRKQSGQYIPLVGVLTDYAPHSYWLFDEVDCYVVPSTDTAEKLTAKGVDLEKIRVYGIPVDPKFRLKKDPVGIRKKLGLVKNIPVVLIMGGTQGLGVIEKTVEAILEDEDHTYQLMIVTGTNKKLYSKLEKIKKEKHLSLINVFSYLENIDELMTVADVIVTKAGGMTTAEALSKNVPILIVDPIPGHEGMNTEYLTSRGAAIKADDCGDIQKKLNELFDSKQTLDKMKDNTRKIAKIHSALDIARIGLEDFKEKK